MEERSEQKQYVRVKETMEKDPIYGMSIRKEEMKDVTMRLKKKKSCWDTMILNGMRYAWELCITNI